MVSLGLHWLSTSLVGGELKKFARQACMLLVKLLFMRQDYSCATGFEVVSIMHEQLSTAYSKTARVPRVLILCRDFLTDPVHTSRDTEISHHIFGAQIFTCRDVIRNVIERCSGHIL